jgi:hypothetical protein
VPAATGISSRRLRTSAVTAALIVRSRSGAKNGECSEISAAPDFCAAS